MNIFNILNKKSELLVPNWLTAFFLIEWIFNSQLEYKPFIGGFILLSGAVQITPERKITQWLNYAFRLALVVAILIVSHQKEFFSGVEKLGF